MKKGCPNSFDGLEEYSRGFANGWDACAKHLCEIPWDKAMKELEDFAREHLHNKECINP